MLEACRHDCCPLIPSRPLLPPVTTVASTSISSPSPALPYPASSYPYSSATLQTTAIMATPTKLANATTSEPPSSIERVQAWEIDQVADVLTATSLHTPRPARAAHVTLDIPLDDEESPPPPRARPSTVHTVYKRREPIRRDSQKRREALLKGKEGSRRRQRWENDRLLSNPHAQPPLPSDWQVQPTYRQHSVPYFLAPLWDAEYARNVAARKAAAAKTVQPATKEEAVAQKVTADLRAKMKRARGAKGLLQDLEGEIRGFVEQWELKQQQLEKEGLIEETDSEDDEIVFVGRNGAMSDEKRKQAQGEAKLEKDKLIFQSLVDDHGASFGYACCSVLVMRDADSLCSRYLVHSIAAYYGLKTWSVTTGNPARREAYVGLKEDPVTRRPSLTKSELPRPLWAVV